MKKNELGDRMKSYEKAYTCQKISPPNVLCVRIDGKGFHRFTKNFDKPFDKILSNAMVDTTYLLMEETHACVGYTQSDEISLFWYQDDAEKEYLFGGKVSKLNSVLASMCTAFFHERMKKGGIPYSANYGLFDCRAFSVPNIVEASNVLFWRALDARKNSVLSFFRSIAGHKKMQNLKQEEMKEVLLKEYGADWNLLENRFKYGIILYFDEFVQEIEYDVYLKIPDTIRSNDTLVRRKSIVAFTESYCDLSFDDRLKFFNKKSL
jgi:tRNA(His) 5'-end guanylyltransferase